MEDNPTLSTFQASSHPVLEPSPLNVTDPESSVSSVTSNLFGSFDTAQETLSENLTLSAFNETSFVASSSSLPDYVPSSDFPYDFDSIETLSSKEKISPTESFFPDFLSEDVSFNFSEGSMSSFEGHHHDNLAFSAYAESCCKSCEQGQNCEDVQKVSQQPSFKKSFIGENLTLSAYQACCGNCTEEQNLEKGSPDKNATQRENRLLKEYSHPSGMLPLTPFQELGWLGVDDLDLKAYLASLNFPPSNNSAPDVENTEHNMLRIPRIYNPEFEPKPSTHTRFDNNLPERAGSFHLHHWGPLGWASHTHGSRAWEPINDFAQEPSLRTGALYGRAVARLSISGRVVGTSWNIGGPYMIGAAHSRIGNIFEVSCPSTSTSGPNQILAGVRPTTEPIQGVRPNSLSVDFGRYSMRRLRARQANTCPHQDLSQGKRDAADRLEDLGIPRVFVNDFGSSRDPLKNPGFETFADCFTVDTAYSKVHGCRDIDYIRCPRVKFRYRVPGVGKSDSDSVSLLPSHIYGSIPTFPAPNNNPPTNLKGKKIYLLSNNMLSNIHPNNCGVSANQVLLSPGGEAGSNWPNSSSNTLFWRNAFEVDDLDVAQGSSGGAHIDQITNRAIGVHSSSHDYFFGSYAVASRIDHTATFLTENRPLLRALRTTGFKFAPAWIGGKGGSWRWLQCPTDTLAAGVVSSNVSNRSVGNLGLVCMPIASNDFYPFDHATVITAGSMDTKRQLIDGSDKMPFDEYINTFLTTGKLGRPRAEDNRFRQSLTMCPPGYYMIGMDAQNTGDNRFIKTIYSLECKAFDRKNRRSTREPRESIGSPSDRSSGGRSNKPVCPGGTFINGMVARAGWLIDGFILTCKGLRPL